MSRAVDASSKLSDEKIDKMLEDILTFLRSGIIQVNVQT